ncbi:MAG: hypothetical protein LBH86_04820 [Oscillospiraceae bacterium]|jgi:hypothetical protein|nr:hypothetical protein [Oscillospiraceae bacterium]
MIYFSLSQQSSRGVCETPERPLQACQESACQALPGSGEPVESVADALPFDISAEIFAPILEESAEPAETAETGRKSPLRTVVRHGVTCGLIVLFLLGAGYFFSLFRWMDRDAREKAHQLKSAFPEPQWESFHFSQGVDAVAAAPAGRATRGPVLLSAVFEVQLSDAWRYELRFVTPDDPEHRTDRGWIITCPLRPDPGGGFVRDAALERTYVSAATPRQIHLDMLDYFTQNAPS